MKSKVAWTQLGLVVLMVGCSGPPPEASPARIPSATASKREMLLVTERSIERVQSVASKEAVRTMTEFENTLAALGTPIELDVSSEPLRLYGVEAREEYRAQVAALEAETQEHLATLRAGVETALWTMASAAGERAQAADFTYRSGYRELDEKVETAIAQFSRVADADTVAQMATFSEYDRVLLDRALQEDLGDLGSMFFYVSPPEKREHVQHPSGQQIGGALARNDETLVTMFLFHRNELDPAVGIDFVQARRIRLERSGMVRNETAWKLDPSSQADGSLPLEDGFTEGEYVATIPNIPQVDVEEPGFTTVRRHTLILEHRTGLRRKDTGDLLAVLAWHIKMSVDSKGRIRIVESTGEQLLNGDTVLATLLEALP